MINGPLNGRAWIGDVNAEVIGQTDDGTPVEVTDEGVGPMCEITRYISDVRVGPTEGDGE